MDAGATYQLKEVKRKRTLYQIIQEEIRKYIAENNLQPGDSMPPETELAQRLNVSRHMVREAVKSLETLGILESRVGAGLFVGNFSFVSLLGQLDMGVTSDLQEILDVLEVRFYTEYWLAERAVSNVTKEQIEELQVILERMRAAAGKGEYRVEDDRAFHQVLWQNTDNAVFKKILDIWWAMHRSARQRHKMPDPADPKAIYQGHLRIFRALKKKDTEELQESIMRHYIPLAKEKQDPRLLRSNLIRYYMGLEIQEKLHESAE